MGKVEAEDITGYILTDRIYAEVLEYLRMQGISRIERVSNKPWLIVGRLMEQMEKKVSYIERTQMVDGIKTKIRLWDQKEMQNLIAEQFHKIY